MQQRAASSPLDRSLALPAGNLTAPTAAIIQLGDGGGWRLHHARSWRQKFRTFRKFRREWVKLRHREQQLEGPEPVGAPRCREVKAGEGREEEGMEVLQEEA